MTFGASPKDSSNIPISSAYVPNVGLIAVQGSANTNTDASSNQSTAVLLALGASSFASGTLQNGQTGNANGTALNVLGYASVAFTVNMSGFTGTVTFKGSEDNTNYDPLYVTQSGTSTISTAVTGSTTTSIHVYVADCASLQSVEAVTSGVSAGNVTVTAHAIPQTLSSRAVNALLQAVAGTALAADQSGTELRTSTYVKTTTAGDTALTLGAATKANSLPVTMASDQLSDITLIASAAFTTTQTTADQTNTMARGVRVVLDVTVVGTGSVTLEIDVKDGASGKYVAQLTGAAVITNSTNTYVVYPGLTPSANAIVSDVLPHTWRVKVTANNANSVSYSVGASLLA